MMTKANPHVSDNALRDYAFKVLASSKEDLRPGTTDAEIRFFCKQLSPDQLTQIYGMFYQTEMVQ
jgi:hypothetical protein